MLSSFRYVRQLLHSLLTTYDGGARDKSKSRLRYATPMFSPLKLKPQILEDCLGIEPNLFDFTRVAQHHFCIQSKKLLSFQNVREFTAFANSYLTTIFYWGVERDLNPRDLLHRQASETTRIPTPIKTDILPLNYRRHIGDLLDKPPTSLTILGRRVGFEPTLFCRVGAG